MRRSLPQEFSHGAARNLGASLSSGSLLVFISQDATPVGERLAGDGSPRGCARGGALLRGRLRPPGRQRGRDARPSATSSTSFTAPGPGANGRRGWSGAVDGDDALLERQRQPSDGSSGKASRSSEDIIMSEDQDWCRRALLAGWEHRLRAPGGRPAFAQLHDRGRLSAASSTRALRPIGATWPARASPNGSCGRRRCATRGARSAGSCAARQARWIPYTVVYELRQGWRGSCSARDTSASRDASKAA